MRKAVAAHQTAQAIFGIERIRPGAGDTPAERAANGEVIESLDFPNLVLDVGLDALFSNSLAGMMGTCHVGTGTAEPATTDEGLATELTSTTNTSSTSTGGNTSPLYGYHRRVFVFGEGQAQGNLTEVGLSNGTTFFNRQLFRDGNGDPVTVTIASDEILRITAEGRWYSDIQTDESTSGSFSFKGKTISYTRSVSRTLWWTDTGSGNIVRNPMSSWGIGLDDPGQAGPEPDSQSVASYTPGDYASTVTAVWDAGSLDGTYPDLTYGENIRDYYTFDLSPGLEVLSTEELTMTLTRTWGRKP